MVESLVLSRRTTNWDLQQPVWQATMHVEGCLNLGSPISDMASSRLTTLIYTFWLPSPSSICQTWRAIPDNVPVLLSSRLWSFSSLRSFRLWWTAPSCPPFAVWPPRNYLGSLRLLSLSVCTPPRFPFCTDYSLRTLRRSIFEEILCGTFWPCGWCELCPRLWIETEFSFSGRGRHRSVWRSRCTGCLLRFETEPNRAGHRVACRFNFSLGRARRPGTCRCRWIPCNDTSRSWTCRRRIQRERLCDCWDFRSRQHRSLVKISCMVCWRICPLVRSQESRLSVSKDGSKGRNDVLSRLAFQRNHPRVPGKRFDDD